MSRIPATSVAAPKPPGQLQPHAQRKLRGLPPPSAPGSGRWNPSSRPGAGAPVEVHNIPRVAPKPVASGISVRKTPKPSLEQLIKTCQHYEFKVAHRYDTKSMAARLLFQLSHEIQELVVALMNAGFGKSPKLEHLETITTEWREIFSNPAGPVPPAVQALARKTPRQVAEYVQQQADKIAALEAAAEEAKGAQASEVGRLREAMRSQAAVGGNSFEREMQRLRDMYEDRLKQEREKHNKDLETVKTQTEEKYFAALQQQERKATADKDCQKDVVVTPTKQRQKQLIESLQGRLREREAQVAQLEARIEALRHVTKQRLADKDDEIARSVASSQASAKNLEQATAEFQNRASFPRLVWLEGRHTWLEGRTNELGDMIGKLQTRLEDCHQHCRGANYRDSAAPAPRGGSSSGAADTSAAGGSGGGGAGGSSAAGPASASTSTRVGVTTRGGDATTGSSADTAASLGSSESKGAEAGDAVDVAGTAEASEPRRPATSGTASQPQAGSRHVRWAHSTRDATRRSTDLDEYLRHTQDQKQQQQQQEGQQRQPWNATTNSQSFSFPPGTSWDAVVQTLGGSVVGQGDNASGRGSGLSRHEFKCKPKQKRCMAVVERAVSAPFPHHCQTVCVKAGTAGRHLAQAGAAADCCGNDFAAAPVSGGKRDCCSGCRSGDGGACAGPASASGARRGPPGATSSSHACATCCGQPGIRNMRKFRNLHGSTNETYGFAWRSWLRNYCERPQAAAPRPGGCPNIHHLRCCPELGMGAGGSGV